MKIVITGSNGYIGKHVVDYLKTTDNQILAIGSDRCESYNYPLDFSTYDIFSGSKNIYDELGKPDLCIHLAWKDGFVHNSRAHMEYLSSHVRFLYDLIDGGIPSISVMGTMHEVGYYEGAINENTPCNPMSQYGIAKRSLYLSLVNYAKNTQCTIKWLRAYYIMGDYRKTKNIFSKILEAADANKTEFPFNSGKNQYDFIDVDDLSQMIYCASVQDECTGIINVCSGIPQQLSAVVEKFIEDNNLKIQLKYGAFPDRPYDSPIVYGDASIIRKIMHTLD